MAQFRKSVSFKKAVIDMEDRTITEYDKDGTRVYSLDTILRAWDGVEGIAFSIQQSGELPDMEQEV